MTFQRLCNLVTKGDLNYYSKLFDIIIEPLGDQLSYQINVVKNGTIVESVEVEPPTGRNDWRKHWIADEVRDQILREKQILHTKYLTA